MKKLYGILLVLLFASCTAVYFNSPQPGNAERLTTVPKELQGKWIDHKDTTIITAEGEYHAEISKDSLGNEIVNRSWTNLSDSLLLFKSDKYYVVNMLDESGHGYLTAVIDIKANGDINWYYPFEPPFFGKRKGLEVDSVISCNEKIKGEEKEIIWKRSKSVKKIKGEYIFMVYYSGKLNNDDLKKIIKKKNLFWVLKKDGTVLKPRDK